MKVLEYPKDQKSLRVPGRSLRKEELMSSEFLINLEEMFKLLKEERNGIGLAATQVGWGVQLFILNCDQNLQPLSREKVFLNPIIKSVGKKTVKDQEGCLSYPGLELKISRPDELVWSYYDLDFQMHEEAVQGYYSRVILHETDHLFGRLFVDQATSTERLKFEKWLKAQ